MRIPTITEEKVETLWHFVNMLFGFFFPLSSVLKEDLPKSVCLVKKGSADECFVCIYWHISVNCNCLFVNCSYLFCLENKKDARNLNLWAPQSYFCCFQLGRPPCSSRCKTEGHTCNIWDVNTPTEPIHRLEIELVLKCLGGLRL